MMSSTEMINLPNDSFRSQLTPKYNESATVEVPPEIFYGSKLDVVIYSILFIISAAGNLTVFTALLKNRNRIKLRINLLIFNLTIADLIVTFIMIPLEIGWRLTESWIAGDEMCRLMMALRAFGPYLSSMVLVCISLDRYFAIIYPLKSNNTQRSRKMLTFAWIISILCSLPQSIIYHVESHPEYPKFEQCVTFNFFTTNWQKTFYNLFCVMALYLVPLLIIICCYARISWEIYQRSKQGSEEVERSSEFRFSARSGHDPTCKSRLHLRRSDGSQIERARNRTLRMTIIIVLAFVWCWTPYVFMVIWYQIDTETANQLDKRIQDILFMFAVSNSCVNPLVYGSYTMNFRRYLGSCFKRCNSRDLKRPSPNRTKPTSLTLEAV